MADGTIMLQGGFTADGNAKTLKLRSDIDWIEIINLTNTAGTDDAHGCKFYWQRGMGTYSVVDYHPAANATLAVTYTANSLELIDTSDYDLGAAVAVTSGSDATRPVYLTASTAGLATGSIVRVYSTDHDTLNGLDFSIDTLVANTSFRLANTIATTPGVVAGTGFYRLVAPNVEIYSMFTPSNRNIANITQAASAVVTTLVDHNYAVGQAITFNVNSDSGMTQINGLVGNITAVTTSTFTVDINSSGFTAFNFPLPAVAPYTPSSVTVVGDEHGSSVDQLAVGKLYNQAYIGVVLQPGEALPAGEDGDVIKWRAGRSFSVDNN